MHGSMQTAKREPHTTQKSCLFVYFGVNLLVFVLTSFGSVGGAAFAAGAGADAGAFAAVATFATGAGAAGTAPTGSAKSYPSIESAPNIG